MYVKSSRHVLVGLIAAGMCGLALPAQASASRAGASHAAYRAQTVAHWRSATVSRMMQPRATTRAATDPKSLNVNWPAPTTSTVPGVALTPTQADDTATNPFKTLHSSGFSYGTAGLTGGWLQEADYTLGAQNTTFSAYWFGGVYGTDAQAAAAVQDVQTLATSSGMQDLGCTSVAPKICHSYNVLYNVKNSDGTTSQFPAFYEVFANGNVAGEFLLVARFNPTTTQFTTLNAFIAAAEGVIFPAVYAATGTPTTGTVKIAGIALEHKVNGKYKATKTLKSKEAAIFLVGLEVSDPSTQPTARIVFSVKGKQVSSRSMDYLETESDGLQVFGYGGKLTSPKKTTWKATVTADVGASEDQQSFTFKVQPKKKK